MTRNVWRTVTVAIAVALAAEVGFVVVTLLRRPPRGPASSSYAAGHRGARGYARLLARGGHEVRRQRVPVDVERPDPKDTVVILGATVDDAKQVAVLSDFVRLGGRLIIADRADRLAWANRFTGIPPYGGDPLLACRPLADVPETRGVQYVESSGRPGFADTDRALPILGCNGSTLAAVAAVERGRVVLVSDPAVFQNYLLGARDNATFAVNAAGGVNRDVVFLEYLHGFGAPSGLAAVPLQWQVAAGVLLLAGLLALLARRRAAAPPAAAAGDQPRPRAAFADAMAARLGASPAKDAAVVARATALRAIADAAGLPPRAAAAEVRAAAARLGLPPHDVDAVLDGAPDADAIAAAGRVLAAVSQTPSRGA